jgi:hypothetical protein
MDVELLEAGVEELETVSTVDHMELIGVYSGCFLPETQLGECEREFVEKIRVAHERKWSCLDEGIPSIPNILDTVKDELRRYAENYYGREIDTQALCGDGSLMPRSGIEWVTRELFQEELTRLMRVEGSGELVANLTVGWSEMLRGYREIYASATYLGHSTSKIMQIIAQKGLLARTLQQQLTGRDNFTTGSVKSQDQEMDQVYFHVDSASLRYATYGYYSENWRKGYPSVRGVVVLPLRKTLAKEGTTFFSGDGLALFQEGGFNNNLDDGYLLLSETDYERLSSSTLRVENPQANPFSAEYSDDAPAEIEIPNDILTPDDRRYLEDRLLKDDLGQPVLIPDTMFDDPSISDINRAEAIQQIVQQKIKSEEVVSEDATRESMFFVPVLDFGDSPGGNKTFKRRLYIAQ